MKPNQIRQSKYEQQQQQQQIEDCRIGFYGQIIKLITTHDNLSRIKPKKKKIEKIKTTTTKGGNNSKSESNAIENQSCPAHVLAQNP